MAAGGDAAEIGPSHVHLFAAVYIEPCGQRVGLGTTRFDAMTGARSAATCSPARNNVTVRQWNSWSLD